MPAGESAIGCGYAAASAAARGSVDGIAPPAANPARSAIAAARAYAWRRYISPACAASIDAARTRRGARAVAARANSSRAAARAGGRRKLAASPAAAAWRFAKRAEAACASGGSIEPRRSISRLHRAAKAWGADGHGYWRYANFRSGERAVRITSAATARAARCGKSGRLPRAASAAAATAENINFKARKAGGWRERSRRRERRGFCRPLRRRDNGTHQKASRKETACVPDATIP
jgi:hypothetical protein